ncbi:cytochrome c [Paraburkholderia caribensis]|uniref:cytochrome c n=1 Tax=Paraburkholderia caribensis TaxID=75105 RepID=UPI0009ED5456|nr:c-type cytochrome [Paraburkholderia caribensis]
MSTHENLQTTAGATPPKRSRIGRWIAIFVALVICGIAGFAAFAWRPSIPEVPTPAASSFPPELVARGQRVAAAGFCASCHTIAGGKPLAGGYAMKTGFGTIYSTNISPDRENGIGAWSEDAFLRAMHEGVARDGSHLFPAFPYDHFTKINDEDVRALYAYIMTRPPQSVPNHPNEMPFPFGIRALQAGWKLLFFHEGRFVPTAGKSVEWNRGAYLTEALSHCSACHTPRGLLGAELESRLYDGAPVDGWFAPALNASNTTPVPWTSEELYSYLTAGVSEYHGSAAGPMAPVVHELGELSPDDLHALVSYVESIGNGDAQIAQVGPAVKAALKANADDLGRIHDRDGRLFVTACASCHYNGNRINPSRPDLGLNSAVSVDDPSNLIHVILFGISARDGAPGIVMPSFARGLSDQDVASIANYLRTTRTSKASWPDLDKKVAQIRAERSVASK